jgi:hypothetical protein
VSWASIVAVDPAAQQRTRIVNLRREPYDVYVGRGGRGMDGYFGNPFRGLHALQLYRRRFYDRIQSDPEFRRRVLALRGKTLGCFCKPRACHGDIIVAWLEAQPQEGETMKLDSKFTGIVQKVSTGDVVPDDQWIVFLATDKALVPTLQFYQQQCVELGAEAPQLASLGALIQRVVAWQQANPGKLKVADVKPSQGGAVLDSGPSGDVE